jgi:hypothetical protein
MGSARSRALHPPLGELIIVIFSRMDDRRAWRIAVHEAGHCLAARLLGLPGCGGASVEPDNAYADVPTDCGAHSICALMAGACAEAIVFGDFDPAGLAVDRELAAAEMASMGVVDGGDMLWEFTFDLLAPYESLITSLAAELWRAGSLEGGEIDAVMFGLAQ